MTIDNRRETKICQHVGEEKKDTRNPQDYLLKDIILQQGQSDAFIWSQLALQATLWDRRKRLFTALKLIIIIHQCPKHENKQTILICALHEAWRAWTEKEGYTVACITMVERFVQHLRHGTCGAFQVLSGRKNGWLKRCCFLWRVMSKDKLYEKLRKKGIKSQ